LTMPVDTPSGPLFSVAVIGSTAIRLPRAVADAGDVLSGLQLPRPSKSAPPRACEPRRTAEHRGSAVMPGGAPVSGAQAARTIDLSRECDLRCRGAEAVLDRP
jgi:hypothetical protein